MYFFIKKVLLILLMSAFFTQIQRFLLKAIVWEMCERFFSSVFNFFKVKVAINENISFTDYMSGIRLPNGSRLNINWKNDNDVTIFNMTSSSMFWGCLVSLVNFSYYSKVHVNIITSSGVMTIFFCKELTRNPEIGNTPEIPRVLPNIWKLGS